MAVYAIGDIQGCLSGLKKLLKKIDFNPKKDTLWFVGDLVNRGDQSLETLRFIYQLGERAICVLGNHDLQLLAQSEGLAKKDSACLKPILKAPDRDELLDWLRHRPLLHHDKLLNFTMIHAGLPKQWSLKRAKNCANELEETLQGKNYQKFLKNMYGTEPSLWSKDLTGWERLRFISNCLTRMRYCSVDGHLELKSKGSPSDHKLNKNICPWYLVKDRKTEDLPIVFGHWSSLLGVTNQPNTHALDTGCLWGGEMTAMRLDNKKKQRISVHCPSYLNPFDFS